MTYVVLAVLAAVMLTARTIWMIAFAFPRTAEDAQMCALHPGAGEVRGGYISIASAIHEPVGRPASWRVRRAQRRNRADLRAVLPSRTRMP